MDFDSTKTLSLEQPSAYASVSPVSIDQSTRATNLALFTQDRRIMTLSTFLGTFSSPYLTKFSCRFVKFSNLSMTPCTQCILPYSRAICRCCSPPPRRLTWVLHLIKAIFIAAQLTPYIVKGNNKMISGKRIEITLGLY